MHTYDGLVEACTCASVCVCAWVCIYTLVQMEVSKRGGVGAVMSIIEYKWIESFDTQVFRMQEYCPVLLFQF